MPNSLEGLRNNFWIRTVAEFMASTAQKTAMGLALAVIALAAVIQSVPVFRSLFSEPYTVDRAEAVPHEPNQLAQVRAGEEVTINFHIVRTRMCKVELDVFINRVSDGAVVHRFPRVPGGAKPVGDWWPVPNSFKTPDHLRPERHCVATTILNECSEGLHTTRAPEACFDVVR